MNSRDRYVDLHVHTCHSDGTDPPRRVVERAHELGFAGLAIADHDTVDGVGEGRDVAQEFGLAFLPATEISAQWRGLEVHVLGYGIDTNSSALRDVLNQLREGRLNRARRIIALLNELGVPVDAKSLIESAGRSVGRMHIARAVHALGYAKSVQGAFDKYIGRDRPAFVSKPCATCTEAIDVIHAADGVAVLAHPGVGNLRKVVETILKFPFDGIEVYHSKHAPEQSERYLALANERGLLVSGGSDCHGGAKGEPELGKVRLPFREMARIMDAAAL